MKFEILLGQSRKQLVLEANNITIDDVALLVANHYGDEWYGCCVSCPEKKSFWCNAVKDYYTELNASRSVYEWAVEHHAQSIRMASGLYIKGYDYREDEETYDCNYNPFEQAGG